MTDGYYDPKPACSKGGAWLVGMVAAFLLFVVVASWACQTDAVRATTQSTEDR